MLALLAMWVGRFRLWTHVWWRTLTFRARGHRGIHDVRYGRGEIGPISMEVRCTCGRVYFRWWVGAQPTRKVRKR